MANLASIRCGFYRIPLPVVLSDSTHGEMRAFELNTIRLTDAEGAEGVGYTYTAGRNGAAVHAILKREIAELFGGEEADEIERMWRKAWWALHYGGRGGPTVLAISGTSKACDGHTMFVFLWWKRGVSAMTQSQSVFKDGTPIGGTERGNKFLPDTTDWFGRFRLAANPSNDWQIDRTAQQENSIYSGIEGVHLQDQAITESMGPITDHGFEHLAPSDQMITRTRRRLLIAARALRDQGILPPGVQNADVFRGARSGYFVSDEKSPWQEIYATQLAASAPRPRRRRTSGTRSVA
jgi:LigXa C-terminal domain like